MSLALVVRSVHGARGEIAPPTCDLLTWAEYLSSQVPGVVTFAHFLLCDLAPGAVRVSSSKSRGFGESFYCGLQTTVSQAQARGHLVRGRAVRPAAGVQEGGPAVGVWASVRGAKAITVERWRPGGRSASSRRRG